MIGALEGLKQKPAYIKEQHNTNCQQFFGPVTNCIFAMPGSNITQQPALPPQQAASTPRVTRPKPATRKAAGRKLSSATFGYRWMEQEPARITMLYQALLVLGWIDKGTSPDHFLQLFEGQECDVRVKWTGTQQHLYYLVQCITQRGYVTLPPGGTKWVVVSSHFVDKESRQFSDFNKQKTPTLKAGIIEQLAELLNGAKPAPRLNPCDLMDEEE